MDCQNSGENAIALSFPSDEPDLCCNLRKAYSPMHASFAEWYLYVKCKKIAFAQALLRLEGLVLGGAASFQGFLDLIRPLLELIITQLLDRCGPSYSLALLEPPLKGAASLMHSFSRQLS